MKNDSFALTIFVACSLGCSSGSDTTSQMAEAVDQTRIENSETTMPEPTSLTLRAGLLGETQLLHYPCDKPINNDLPHHDPRIEAGVQVADDSNEINSYSAGGCPP